ncbi:MAG TPA: small ribosomal subunit Rsm22 family protein [Nitrospira sp.]|nr:small ribosomal subunit Rsm22 family protein [Nitrospira sp.]
MRPLNSKGPATLSPLLLRTLNNLAGGEGIRSGRLAQAVLELSRLFTKERDTLGHSYLDDVAFAAAYLQYFLPVNLSKIQVLLDEMSEETYLKRPTERFSVLDLGSGPGTGALAVLDWWHHRRLTPGSDLLVVTLDNVQNTLGQAQGLWERYCRAAGIRSAKLQTCKGDLERPAKGPWLEQIKQGAPYDVIVLANCLNELYTDADDPITARAIVVAETLSLLAPHGTMIIVEPALRETSRALHQVRDQLLQAGNCTVYSPCLHERQCPALVNPEDWCHEERAWEPPASIREIDREVGFIKDALKFSYLLLRKDGRTIASRGRETFRVVSELRILKGDKRAWLCNELGRPEVGRLDRARSETNAAWDECQRGTIVRIEGVKRKEGATLERIPEDATVEIIRSV